MNNSEKEMWDKLQKEYLTTEQRLEIIRGYNRYLNQTSFDAATKHLLEYIDDLLK